jgi:hypothetical protein
MSMIQELDQGPAAPPPERPLIVQRVTSHGPYYAAIAGAAIGIFASFLALFAAHKAAVCRARHQVIHEALLRSQQRCHQALRQATLRQGGAPQPAPAALPTAPLDPADYLLEHAQRHYINGDFAQAITVARMVRPQDARERNRVHRLIGAAACNLGDLRRATQAYQALGAENGQFLSYVCRRAGYVYRHGRFVKGE